MGTRPVRVTVHRHGGMWEATSAVPHQWRPGHSSASLPDGSTVADLLRILNVDPDLVCMIAVDGRSAALDTRLAEGSSVDLIPPITGG